MSYPTYTLKYTHAIDTGLLRLSVVRRNRRQQEHVAHFLAMRTTTVIKYYVLVGLRWRGIEVLGARLSMNHSFPGAFMAKLNLDQVKLFGSRCWQ